MEQEKKELMLKLYQFKEQNKKAEQGETWIIFYCFTQKFM